jgi:signal transduction histidine kinase
MRLTIRTRLTLLYGGLFIVAGIALLLLTYLLMRNNLQEQLSRLQKQDYCQAHPYVGCGFTIPKERAAQAQRTYEHATLNSLLTQGGIALVVVSVAAFGLGALVADRALRPIDRVTATARRVADSHNLAERIAYTGPRDGIKELADTFDTMLARLARTFDSQRRFVANASHELRTPLAINRTLVEVAVDRSDATDDVKRLGESLLVVNARHERLIDGLLTLADSEQPVLDPAPVDLADLAGHVIDQATSEAGDRQVTLHQSLLTALTAGDPVLLERLAQNLIENAIRHNHTGGELWVTTQPHSDHVQLIVANTGSAVPAYEMETIFEPFRRLNADRLRSNRGNGLGLSIVRAIANAHGGTANARPREGGGLTITIKLPLTDSPRAQDSIAAVTTGFTAAAPRGTTHIPDAEVLPLHDDRPAT